MTSKKSVKMDWATLAVNSNPDLVLPTAPDPNRYLSYSKKLQIDLIKYLTIGLTKVEEVDTGEIGIIGIEMMIDIIPDPNGQDQVIEGIEGIEVIEIIKGIEVIEIIKEEIERATKIVDGVGGITAHLDQEAMMRIFQIT